jgi:hypothetical protein
MENTLQVPIINIWVKEIEISQYLINNMIQEALKHLHCSQRETLQSFNDI